MTIRLRLMRLGRRRREHEMTEEQVPASTEEEQHAAETEETEAGEGAETEEGTEEAHAAR